MSSSDDVSQVPISTTIGGATRFVVPTVIAIFAAAVYFVNDMRATTEIKANQVITTAQQAINTLDINTLTSDVKKNRDDIATNQADLMGLLRDVLAKLE